MHVPPLCANHENEMHLELSRALRRKGAKNVQARFACGYIVRTFLCNVVVLNFSLRLAQMRSKRQHDNAPFASLRLVRSWITDGRSSP
jgi:hypothetical protein